MTFRIQCAMLLLLVCVVVIITPIIALYGKYIDQKNNDGYFDILKGELVECYGVGKVLLDGVIGKVKE